MTYITHVITHTLRDIRTLQFITRSFRVKVADKNSTVSEWKIFIHAWIFLCICARQFANHNTFVKEMNDFYRDYKYYRVKLRNSCLDMGDFIATVFYIALVRNDDVGAVFLNNILKFQAKKGLPPGFDGQVYRNELLISHSTRSAAATWKIHALYAACQQKNTSKFKTAFQRLKWTPCDPSTTSRRR